MKVDIGRASLDQYVRFIGNKMLSICLICVNEEIHSVN